MTPARRRRPAASGANDIAVADRADLADGGKLTWPIDTYPPNFNLNQLDGALADNASVMGALMPGMFNIDPSAQPVVNTDFATSAVLTATEPKQIVTYKLNPKATWDDGTPITEADFEAQWKALSGTNPAFHIASSNGYEKIESVVKGADDKEVVVTFRRPLRRLAGLVQPAVSGVDQQRPGRLQRRLEGEALTTAGPFKIDSHRRHTAKTVTLSRNDEVVGPPGQARPDHLPGQIDRDAQTDALSNGEIDFLDVGSDVNKLKRAQDASGITLHRSAAPNFRPHHDQRDERRSCTTSTSARRWPRPSTGTAIAKTLLGPLGVEDDAARQPHLHDEPEGLRRTTPTALPVERRGAQASCSTTPAGSCTATPARRTASRWRCRFVAPAGVDDRRSRIAELVRA